MSANPALRRIATIQGTGPAAPTSTKRPALQRLETQRWFGETSAIDREEPMPLSRRRTDPPRPSTFPFMFELPRTSMTGPLLLILALLAGLFAAIAMILR